MDLALNNLQGLICHKTQQTKQTNPAVEYTTVLESHTWYYIVLLVLSIFETIWVQIELLVLDRNTWNHSTMRKQRIISKRIISVT